MRAILIVLLGLLIREGFNHLTGLKAASDDQRLVEELAKAGNLTLTVNKSQYKIGEPLNLSFSVSQSMFVRIVIINALGKIETLFPNEFQKESYCFAGQEYHIPPQGSDYTIAVGGPVGTDKIRGIGSPHFIPEQSLVFTPQGQFDPVKMATYKVRAALEYRVN